MLGTAKPSWLAVSLTVLIGLALSEEISAQAQQAPTNPSGNSKNTPVKSTYTETLNVALNPTTVP